MSSPAYEVAITITLKPGGDEGYVAAAQVEQPASATAFADTSDQENPYEAAWNALAGVLTLLGYNEEDDE